MTRKRFSQLVEARAVPRRGLGTFDQIFENLASGFSFELDSCEFVTRFA